MPFLEGWDQWQNPDPRVKDPPIEWHYFVEGWALCRCGGKFVVSPVDEKNFAIEQRCPICQRLVEESKPEKPRFLW